MATTPGAASLPVRLGGMAMAAGIALCNGLLTSPLFDPALFYIAPMTRTLVGTSDLLLWLNSAFLWAVTLSLGGMPAALYERLRRHDATTPASLLIWVAVTAVLALPGIAGLAGLFEVEPF